MERELTFLGTKKASLEDFFDMEKTILDMELAINENNHADYVSANLLFH
ncbi:hypothetical protein [Bacillus sp. M6-12]